MHIEPIYYAIFFDLAKPKFIEHAMNKRIDQKQFLNLIDNMGRKTVMLKNNEDLVSNYKIISVSTFNIANTVDDHFFVVCECEKF